MPLKPGATVRVVNIDPKTQEAELYKLFTDRNLTPISPGSLCPSSSAQDATQVATVTFKSSSEAKRALNLTGTLLGESKIAIDSDFMGLTALAVPKEPKLE